MTGEQLEFDSFTTRSGRVLSVARPWFRVRGTREVFRFLRLVVADIRGRERRRVEAIGPAGEFRAFNVGRPYHRRGLRIPQYIPRAARPPKSGDGSRTKRRRRRAA